MSRPARAPAPFPDDPSVTPVTSDAARRWRALFGSEPPLAAGLVAQAVAWQEQVLVHGDVAPAVRRDLAIAAREAFDARERRTDGAEAHPLSAPSAPPCSISLAADEPPNVAGCSNSSATEPIASAAVCNVRPPASDRVSAAPRTRSRTPAPLPPASSQLVPGARLVKLHGGRTHVVEVVEDGFTYEGTRFASLSAIARHITGTHWNGLLFFGLRRRKTYPPKASRDG